MIRKKAEEIVWDLLQAYHDRDTFPNKPSYAEDAERMREIVVSLLETCWPVRDYEREKRGALITHKATSGGHEYSYFQASSSEPGSGGPFFLTQWEREDYERSQRGEPPLGPR